MKIRADEHVSQVIVRIIRELALAPTNELSSVYEVGHRGKDDEHWATAFAKVGGEVVLSADTDFFKKPSLVVAIDRTGLRIIYLPPKWANAPGQMQAAHLLMWWSRIEKKIDEAKPRECWVAKWNLSEEGELERKKIDYASYHRKAKKAKRRANR